MGLPGADCLHPNPKGSGGNDLTISTADASRLTALLVG
jgi:hypothetical protein